MFYYYCLLRSHIQSDLADIKCPVPNQVSRLLPSVRVHDWERSKLSPRTDFDVSGDSRGEEWNGRRREDAGQCVRGVLQADLTRRDGSEAETSGEA